MAIEVERRFLVPDPRGAFAPAGMTRWQRVIQGYFGWVGGLRMRVRILTDAAGNRRALVTLKGPRLGLCRVEYEYPLAPDVAQQALWSLPASRIIRKIRYEICHRDGHVWSVDRFLGANAGLVLAEVELADPDQAVELPSWVGEEVSLDRRFGNSRLARRPMPLLARAA